MNSPTRFYLLSILLSFAITTSTQAGSVAELYGGTGAGGSGNNNGVLESIDTMSGVGTFVSDPTGDVFARGISGLAFDNNGTTLYASLVGAQMPFQLLTLDAMTGNTLNTVSITSNAQNLQIQDLATNPLTNVLYGVTPNSGGLYTIDKTTGVATLIGNTGVQRSAIAFDAMGNLWQTTDNDELVQLDPITGMRIGSATTLSMFYNAFTILQDGRFLAAPGDEDAGPIYVIDTAGNENLLGNSGINTIGDLASRFAAATPPPTNGVPEGGNTLALLAFALLTITAARRLPLCFHRRLSRI